MENSVACARKNWKFAIRTVNTITFQYRVKEKMWKKKEVKMVQIFFFFFNVVFFIFLARCHVMYNVLFLRRYVLACFLLLSIIHFDWIICFICLKVLILVVCLFSPVFDFLSRLIYLLIYYIEIWKKTPIIRQQNYFY